MCEVKTHHVFDLFKKTHHSTVRWTWTKSYQIHLWYRDTDTTCDTGVWLRLRLWYRFVWYRDTDTTCDTGVWLRLLLWYHFVWYRDTDTTCDTDVWLRFPLRYRFFFWLRLWLPKRKIDEVGFEVSFKDLWVHPFLLGRGVCLEIQWWIITPLPPKISP